MKLTKIIIKRYRSISNLTIEIGEGLPLIICGSNNVGKTNLLRAIELFFSLDKDKFDRDKDIPYDIAEGRSTGGRYSTAVTGFFEDGLNKYIIQAIFGWKKDQGNILQIKAKRDNVKINENEARRIIKSFRFMFIEASNIDIPKIIDEIIDEEILPLGLDTLRKKQRGPLKIFGKFIKESEKSVDKIEEEIEKILNIFITDIPGIDTKGWRVEILFAEYKKLREAISGLIDFTLYDKNKKKMESKGSGIQRVVLLSLIKYIADRSKRRIIWGIDEPEAFLHPHLQKRTFEILKTIAEKQPVFFTTHSPHFVDIENVDNTVLLEAGYEEKEYAKRKDQVFYKVKTFIDERVKDFEKIQKIKEHLGIFRNDGWTIMKYNILVEGEEDKNYLIWLMKRFGCKIPNILVAGGVTKIRGYLQFLAEYCRDLKFKPKIRCILDHDTEGKAEYKSLSAANSKGKYGHFELILEMIQRCDGDLADDLDYEIEDLIFPDIIREAANKFLKKRGYRILRKNDLKDRFKKAYNRKGILNFFTDRTKLNNPSEQAMNFEDNNSGLKHIICEKSFKFISDKENLALDTKYPTIRKYIESLSS